MPETKDCPFCGEKILSVAVKCKYCEEYLDDELRESQRPRRSAGKMERLIAPVEISGMALVAGYMGLFSLFPLVGIIPAIVGILTGRAGLKEIERKPHLSGKFRSWFAIIVGTFCLILWSIMGLALLSSLAEKSRR